MPKSITDIMHTCQITTQNKTALLNDQFRQSAPHSPHWNFTPLARKNWHELWLNVKNFNDFNPDNDPYGERGFGKIELNGSDYYWKIDYFDKNMEYLSPDPANPALTTRIVTIMHSCEY